LAAILYQLAKLFERDERNGWQLRIAKQACGLYERHG
jgi:hypothetical protein